MEELPYPTVKHYLSWVRNRMTVCFRRLEQPKVGVHPPDRDGSAVRWHWKLGCTNHGERAVFLLSDVII